MSTSTGTTISNYPSGMTTIVDQITGTAYSGNLELCVCDNGTGYVVVKNYTTGDNETITLKTPELVQVVSRMIEAMRDNYTEVTV